jgi:hypothetical protein
MKSADSNWTFRYCFKIPLIVLTFEGWLTKPLEEGFGRWDRRHPASKVIGAVFCLTGDYVWHSNERVAKGRRDRRRDRPRAVQLRTYSWGSGTLIFKGKRYPLTVSGIGLGSVGVNEYTGSGTVTGLKRPQDINGIFARVGIRILSCSTTTRCRIPQATPAPLPTSSVARRLVRVGCL